MRTLLLIAVLLAPLATLVHAGSEPAPSAEESQPGAAPETAGKPVPDMPIVEKKELEGGLIIEEMKIGEGYEVKPGDTVVAFYHGTVKESGAKFDSAFDRGAPIPFSLNQVIPGWQKGVPGMKIGGIRKLTIPAAMAYGSNPPPGSGIPSNADLVFVVQLEDALQVTDIKAGEGKKACPNCVAVTSHVIKDKDGKVIEESTKEEPYIWFPGEFQPVNDALVGMKVGGKRSIVVPAMMNISNPQAGVDRPSNIPVTIEIELHAVRNFPNARGGASADGC
jgi:FKBP-type peptidyl-prolyl cis-trans isomerase